MMLRVSSQVICGILSYRTWREGEKSSNYAFNWMDVAYAREKWSLNGAVKRRCSPGLTKVAFPWTRSHFKHTAILR